MNETSAVHPVRYHLLMCSFDGADTTAPEVDRLKSDRALSGCEIEGEAIVSRSPAGKIRWAEKGSAGIGAAVGATAMGVVGLVGGPVILPIMLVVGAVAGGLVGHFAGRVLPPDDLKEVAESLPPRQLRLPGTGGHGARIRGERSVRGRGRTRARPAAAHGPVARAPGDGGSEGWVAVGTLRILNVEL
jgi:hypothetical protein